VIEVSASFRGCRRTRTGYGALTRGKLVVMREDDREQRGDDEATHRTDEHQQQAKQAPVIRLLANPRRIRRA